MFETEVIQDNDEHTIKDIILIKGASFPAGWEYGDAWEYYCEMLKNKDNISICLKDQGKRIGYLLAIPHNKAVAELRNDDKLMRDDALRYYIETVAILPNYRKKNGFPVLLERLKQELEKRDIHTISLHARIMNSFSTIIQKKLKITQIRPVTCWKYTNYKETVDYIEAALG